MTLTKQQKQLLKQLESGGCYIYFETNLLTNESLVYLRRKDGYITELLTRRTVEALESRGLLVRELTQSIEPNYETHHFTLNTEAWAKLKPVQHGGKRANAGSKPKPEGEAQKLHIPGHRWAAKDPTYQILVKLTAKERKDCYSLLFATCRGEMFSLEQLELFSKIKELPILVIL
jgi:hypothetical protein